MDISVEYIIDARDGRQKSIHTRMEILTSSYSAQLLAPMIVSLWILRGTDQLTVGFWGESFGGNVIHTWFALYIAGKYCTIDFKPGFCWSVVQPLSVASR